MTAPPGDHAAPAVWLRERARSYALALGAPPATAQAVADAVAPDTDPAALTATVRRAVLACDADADAGFDQAAWVRALARDQGVDTDPARAVLAQTAPMARTPLAARPFKRTPLRRALSRALWRPLAALLRPVQLLTGRVAPP